jgi:hypothetical protein
MPIEFEEQIAAAFREYGRVVALGRPGEVFGFGRLLSSEEDWWNKAVDLMSSAVLIICIPSMHSGTKKELDHIIDNGYLQKTIFIVPTSYGGLSHKIMKREWKDVIEFMSQRGVNFPTKLPFNMTGVGHLLCVDENGSCFVEPLKLPSRRKLREAIGRLQLARSKNFPPLSDGNGTECW